MEAMQLCQNPQDFNIIISLASLIAILYSRRDSFWQMLTQNSGGYRR